MARKLTAPTLACLSVFCAAALLRAAPARNDAPARKPMEVLNGALAQWSEIVQPPEGQPARTFVTRVRVVKAEGLPGVLRGATAEIAYQAPDRLRVVAEVGGNTYAFARSAQQLWVDIPSKHLALLGKGGVPRFKAHPDDLDDTKLPDFALPVTPAAAGFLLTTKAKVLFDEGPAGASAGSTILKILPWDAKDTFE